MPKKASSNKAQPTQIHELKITLRDSKPPIWRRVAVPSDIRLSDLHYVIQIVMGWENSHLHQFIFPDNRPKPTREEINELRQTGRWDKLEECMRRDHCVSDIRFELENIEDEKKVKLSELAPAVKNKFIYEYDFGDGWEHLIEVVKIGPPAEGVKYPVCLAGKFACPPDDCGGIWGYYDMLEVLKNPKHKDYKDIRGWMPPGFKPERFNLEAINAELATMRSGKDRRA